ncbi:MAG: rod shape-determining protein RodA [Deltaproteobacteria bacterium]|nr:MAG: rod shape-determining protein RodA [Deltaproteobacteria bacterium]
MIDRRLFTHFDWVLFLMTLLFFGISLFEIYSASNAGGAFFKSPYVIRQGIWFLIGLFVFFVLIFIDFHFFERWAPFFYWSVNIILVYVLFDGKLVGGSQRWLSLGFMNIQPSELAKLSVIIMLARYFSKNMFRDGLGIRELVLPIIYTLIPFVLIARQPDLGTAGIIVLIAAFMTIFVKIERKNMYSLLAIIFLTGIPFVSFFLKDYQKERILVFLNPGKDPLGAGYHIIQSKIAIGSGMFSGKGFCLGTQNALSFLPEQHTDFIFSVYAEEWGFIGSFLFLLFYFLVLVWGIKIAGSCRNAFGVILSVGLISLLFWQFFINLGMVMGLLPVVGMPLPLISYGGSSVLTIMIALGLLMNISMRKFLSR